MISRCQVPATGPAAVPRHTSQAPTTDWRKLLRCWRCSTTGKPCSTVRYPKHNCKPCATMPAPVDHLAAQRSWNAWKNSSAMPSARKNPAQSQYSPNCQIQYRVPGTCGTSKPYLFVSSESHRPVIWRVFRKSTSSIFRSGSPFRRNITDRGSAARPSIVQGVV